MSAFSDRLLTALGPGALGNASPRIFHPAFLNKKKDYLSVYYSKDAGNTALL
jgi:hypothetical protein